MNFFLISDQPIDEETARAHQINQGKHPAGYGFYDFKCVPKDVASIVNPSGDIEERVLTYKATWNCQSSCD